MQQISIDKIKIDNTYLRLDTDVSELEKSISTVGVIAPLIINKDFRLLAGGRRFHALRNLGHQDIPVVQVDLDDYEQELISIDENIVRKDLHKLEFEANLSRARTLYTEIIKRDQSKQDSIKLELENEDHSLEPEQLNDVEAIASEKFVRDIKDKTGLSSNQIYQAMRRDEQSAPAVKDARNRGELSVTHTNELIKLKADEQEKILPLISEKTAAELRKIVKESKVNGINSAVQMAKQNKPHAREMQMIEKLLKNLAKNAAVLEAENVSIDGDILHRMQKKWSEVQSSMQNILG